MLFFRHWRDAGPAIITGMLLVELLLGLLQDTLPGLRDCEPLQAWLDLAEMGTTLLLFVLTTQRVHKTRHCHRRQCRNYVRLSELGHVACAEPDSTKMLQRCITLVVDVLKCDAAAYVQSDEAGHCWRARATAGRYASLLPKEADLPWGPGSFGKYVLHTTEQPVHVLEFKDENRFTIPKMLEHTFKSAIAIRISPKQHPHGVLIAIYRKRTRCDKEAMRFLRNLSVLLARYLETDYTMRALRSHEDLFLQLAGHIEDVLYVANADGSKVHYVSPAYEKRWQASARALYQDPRVWLNAVHEDDVEEAKKIITDHARGMQAERSYRVVRGDGSVRWICDRSFPIVDPDGKVTRVAGLATDITKVRRARDMANQLALSDERTACAKAETHIRTRDEVLAIVSHDLRTPLSAVMMAAQRPLSQGDGDARIHKFATRIQHAAGRMERLVQDLLEVSRLESGVLKLERREVAVEELWQEASEAFDARSGGGVNVAFAPLDGVRACHLSIDSMRILQALGNLVTNAITFSPDGATVDVSVHQENEHLVFRVADTGPGIAPPQLEGLFKPFWQGSRHDKRGLGLGLHIAKGIVEAHGGSIGAQARQPHGTVVWFSLPVETNDAQAPAPQAVAAIATLN